MKYVVMGCDEAVEKAIVGALRQCQSGHKPGKCSHYVVALVDEAGAVRDVVGHDGGAPEDQILFRDWDWVAPALQKLADERDEALDALKSLHAATRYALRLIGSIPQEISAAEFSADVLLKHYRR